MGQLKTLNNQDDPQNIIDIFSTRLCDAGYPYGFIARYGIHDLLSVRSDKIRPVIPQIIIPIKNALNTKNPEIILATLRIIQHMCLCGKLNKFSFFNKSLILKY